jgi:hypothetical protein
MRYEHISEQRSSGRLSPEQRSLRARMAAHAMHARHDSREVTANARKAFLDRFEREVDPNGVLPVHERRRRAESAKRAHMTRLALRSAESRRMRTMQARPRGAEVA